MSQVDLEDVITSAVEDSISPEAPDTTEVADTPDTPDTTDTLETSPEAPEAPIEEEVVPEADSTLVASPTAKAAAAATKPAEQDDFEKKFGIPKESSPGRENRIPYSRVTKIVAKAIKDAEVAFAPKIQEFETKLKTYETQITQAAELKQRVDNFEKALIEDKPGFLQKLRTVPGYAELLDPKPAVPSVPAVVETSPEDERPAPDQEHSDGSKIYSLEGLDKLNAWNRAQARKETLEEVKKIYGPIAQDHEERQKQAQFEKYQKEVLIPQVEAQIKEAQTWTLFKENETEIAKLLNENPAMNLERAYQTVVFPKLMANKDIMRKQILAELKKAPLATSAPSSGVKPLTQPVRTGPRDLEDIIKEAASGLQR